MTPDLTKLLDRLATDGRAFDATQPDRLNRRRNLEPESARVLHALVAGTSPTAVLELGTSNGYSTIWLADALTTADGSGSAPFTTVDNDPGRAGEARANIAAAGFTDRVHQVVDDGLQVLTHASDGAYPFIFLDAERPLYVDWWPQLQRVLTDGGLLVVDNALSHADQVTDFRALVDAAAGYRSLVLPVGAGLLVIAKQG
ncbi:O-methyltransferase [uncultured Corynebacterium sp.]|uniref:O-methyltransferase n=1 Tax=uncultured Corynebacterium sp. TaxID=159447 RepID=UPI0025DC7115|nr:class I SAM-dependent methyltransferase [uncultured Corynebacterium sp.]